MKAFFFLSTMMIFSAFAWGGGTIAGNSGHGVLCTAEGPRLRLLDFYEMEIFDKVEAKLGEPNASAESKALNVIQWIEQYDPERAQAYRTALGAFFSRVDWSSEPLPYVPDSHPTVLPTGCTEVQLAIQSRPDGQVRYAIDQSLWNQLNHTHQAGLILHEILYSDAIDLGHESSVQTRAFLRLLVKSIDAIKGGPIYKYAYWDSVLHNYFDHPLIYTLANGEQLFFVGADEIGPDGRPSFRGGGWGLRAYVCGYRTVTGENAKFCSPVPGKRTQFLVVVDDEGSRIVKIFYPNTTNFAPPGYLANPQDFGLAYPAIDFESPSWMVLKDDHYFEYPDAKMWCAAVTRIVFTEPISPTTRFLPSQRISSCVSVLDPQKPSALLIQGRWRGLLPGSVFQVRFAAGDTQYSRPVYQQGAFARPESIAIGKFMFDAVEMSGGTDQLWLTLAAPRELVFKEGKCSVTPSGFGGPRIYWGPTETGGHDIEFLGSVNCQLIVAGQHVQLYETHFDADSGVFLSGYLVKNTRLKVIVKDKSGKLIFRGTKMIEAQQGIYPYSEPGYLLTYEDK
jgi:hypothetical protein